ncbi:MAG TPA: hypothetical protein VFI90_01290 [Rubrobacter sp.]|nr:hypothetical protein [Rubrobacter sp.]
MVKNMDGAHNGRHYKAGDTVKLEIVLHHRANLREVRVVFEHTHDKSVAPLIARARPHPISERGSDGLIMSRLQSEIVITGALTPGVYELTRISYETAGGQLGHLPEGEDLKDVARMTFEVVGEPQDTPSVVDITFADG